VIEELLCWSDRAAAAIEDRVGDIRREIAEADKTSEIGRAHAFALGKRTAKRASSLPTRVALNRRALREQLD